MLPLEENILGAKFCVQDIETVIWISQMQKQNSFLFYTVLKRHYHLFGIYLLYKYI